MKLGALGMRSVPGPGLIPGASRSGMTISGGLATGLTREAAARFSFLLSIPVILLAGGLESLELLRQGFDAPWSRMLVGFVVSAVSAYLCIDVFVRFVGRIGLLPSPSTASASRVVLLLWAV
ncbi:MAG: undecaprenyl-diphosphate phosphatase [Planctomycetota bacterium]